MDIKNYNSIAKIKEDIESIKIQGATNVAIAVITGIKLLLKQTKFKDYDDFINKVFSTGKMLAYARPNEPLAKNGVRYIRYVLKVRHSGVREVDKLIELVLKTCDDYLKMIKVAKDLIVVNSKGVLEGKKGIFTHCHSTTAERVIIEHSHNHPDVKVACTETRPLYQGHITARNLVKAGVDTTLTVDNAGESFILGRDLFDVDIMLIGSDEILIDGSAINKVGSLGFALACKKGNVPAYVVASVLKVDPLTTFDGLQIEHRSAKEVWENAPEGLNLFNPAFDYIDKELITGFITEEGVLTRKDLKRVMQKRYAWIMDSNFI